MEEINQLCQVDVQTFSFSLWLDINLSLKRETRLNLSPVLEVIDISLTYH